MKLFRERLLARLVERHAISDELAAQAPRLEASRLLRARRRSRSPSRTSSAIEDTAAYLVREPLSLQKLVYLDGQQAVLYRSRMNPSLGRNFEAMDPLEWLARMRLSGRPRSAPRPLPARRESPYPVARPQGIAYRLKLAVGSSAELGRLAERLRLLPQP